MSFIIAARIVLQGLGIIGSNSGSTRFGAPNFGSYIQPKALVNEHGAIVTFCLIAVGASGALSVMDLVERYVVCVEDEHVVAFLNSFLSSYNMVGVAGAIVAQVAISAISLTRLEESHWTAEAFFISSLVTGCLSVYFSCAISPTFHGLHSAETIKDFLTKPIPAAIIKKINLIKMEPLGTKDWPNNLNVDQKNRLRALIESGRWKVASPFAALMLVAPMTLLAFSLNTFLVGLGIYLGKLCTKKLIPSYGLGAYGILVFYIFSTLYGLIMYYIIQSFKDSEEVIPIERWREILYDKEVGRPTNQQVDPSPIDDRDVGASPNPERFQQSRHVRGRRGIHFTSENEAAQGFVGLSELRPSQGRKHTTKKGALDSTDEKPTLNIEFASGTTNLREMVNPNEVDGSTKRSDQNKICGSNEIAPNEVTSQPEIENVQKILEELIRVQEESLRINRRLCQAFKAG